MKRNGQDGSQNEDSFLKETKEKVNKDQEIAEEQDLKVENEEVKETEEQEETEEASTER